MRAADFFAERADQADIEEALRLPRRQGGQPPDSEDRVEDPKSPGGGPPTLWTYRI